MNAFKYCLYAVLCVLLALPAMAAEPLRLRYANFPPAATFPSVQMDRWISEVSRQSNGKVIIDSFPGGALLDARSMLRGVLKGQADIGCLSIAYHPGTFPLLSAFELPLGFTSAEQASELFMKAIREFKPEELAKVKVLTAFTSPPSQILSRKPVPTLADLKGLSLRSSGILAEQAALLGAHPVSMPQSETPDALQRGAVDGVFTSLDVLKDMNYAESCPYGLFTNLSVYPMIVIMNQKVWNSLPKEVQESIDVLAVPHARWTGNYVDAHAQKAFEWGKEQHNINYTALSAADSQKAKELLAPVIANWKATQTKAGLPAEAMLEFIAKGLQ